MNKSQGSLIGLLAFLSGGFMLGCGQSQEGAVVSSQENAKIIGGAPSTGKEDFALSTVLVYDLKQSSICTGSILSSQILVTAAHCVSGPSSNLRVVFSTDLEQSFRSGNFQSVVAYRVSPFWASRQNEQLNTGDIALVRFSGGLPPGYKATQILGSASSLTNGETVLLAGYGLSDGVQQTGSGRLRSVETTIKSTAFSRTEILIEQSKGKGACHGDSGGPAYVRRAGKLVLAGVTSRGVNDPNDHCNVSAAYTSVPFYASWIVSTSQELTRRAVPSPAPRSQTVPVRNLASVSNL